MAIAVTSEGSLWLDPKDSNYLLVMLQPDASGNGLTIDQIRDKLVAADMSEAVLLDGSDSVMMYLDHDWKVAQGQASVMSIKPETTKIGLGFFYEPGTEPHRWRS